MSRRAIEETIAGALWVAILYALWWRFQWAFSHNPLDYLFSDPARHYENGKRFFNPTFMGSVDPFLYQLYLWLVITISNQQSWIISMITGLLAASMPLFWYLFLKEMLPRSWAAIGCLVIAITPSLAVIYGYFMNETLLLNLMGLAFWLTWRSLRIRTFHSFVLAAFVWSLASITRFIAFPMACACLAYLMWRQREYIFRPLTVVICFTLLSIWPMLHSYKVLHVYAPFGFSLLAKVYAASGAKIVDMHTDHPGAFYTFSSPSLYGPGPLEPLHPWQSPRQGTYTFRVDLEKGDKDWKRALKAAQEQNLYGFFKQLKENILLFTFDESWPDSTERTDYNPYLLLNRQLRWMWAPLIALSFIALVPFLRTRPACDQRFFLLLTLMLISLMFVQQNGVMEGRYRKPLEPLLLVSAVVVIRHFGRRSFAHD